MWTYFGSKSRMASLYPAPIHDTIIEPFAGTARYSLRYWDKNVILIDKYEVIINIWKWLQKSTVEDINNLPHFFKPGQPIDDFEYPCQAAKDLLGFVIGYGMERPRKTASEERMINRPNHINFSLNRIAASLEKIRHWKIIHGSYEEAPDVEATWFIDPPYQHGGKSYVHSNRHIDYGKLAGWCKSRKGQVIVCENTRADWMEFKKMSSHKVSKGINNEAIWSNVFTDYHSVQTLF